ncbi:MAG TPA: hypothetical protein VMH04_20645 [Candidatus Solibacter sp.]|nr:hypothetical protein [Candidatus Solibacter sp.]
MTLSVQRIAAILWWPGPRADIYMIGLKGESMLNVVRTANSAIDEAGRWESVHDWCNIPVTLIDQDVRTAIASTS